VTAAPLHWHDSLDSTQDDAHRLAAAGAAHGAAVAARVQTVGRGTRGRLWESGRGGLWLSVICRPAMGVATEVVGLRVGLALAELLDPQLPAPHRITLKWPNDLILGQKKVAGVLAEARWHGDQLVWMVIGVGLNVRNVIPEALAATAVRLADVGLSATAQDLASPVARAVADASLGSAPLSPGEVAAFESRDWLRGRAVSQPAPGIAEGITATGRLRVRSPAGILSEVTAPVQLTRQA